MSFFFRGGGGSEINNILNQVFREIGKEVINTEKKHKQSQATNFSKKSLNDFSSKNKNKAKKSNSKDLTLFDNQNAVFENNAFHNTKKNKKNTDEQDLWNWLVEDNILHGDSTFEKQFFKQGKGNKGGQQQSWQSDDGIFSSQFSFQTFEFDFAQGGGQSLKKNKKNNFFEDVVIDQQGKKSKKRQPEIIQAKTKKEAKHFDFDF